MTRIQRLKKQAMDSCKFRKHVMTRWAKVGCKEDQFGAVCKRCGKVVVVNPNPAPNDIDISGEAVALNCKN